jgi:hypothetical protein
MPWKEHRTVHLREQFVLQAKEPGANVVLDVLERSGWRTWEI